jgi:hypothetical protein
VPVTYEGKLMNLSSLRVVVYVHMCTFQQAISGLCPVLIVSCVSANIYFSWESCDALCLHYRVHIKTYVGSEHCKRIDI